MTGPFAEVPLLDQHAHSLLRRQPATVHESRACFTESDAPEIIDRHVPWSLFYRRALRDLAAFFECQPTEDAVLEARSRRPLAHLAADMFNDAGIAGVLADLGLRVEEYYDLSGLRAPLPCPIFPVLRLETLAEGLIGSASDWPDLKARFAAAVETAASGDLWALNTIIAYRTGLVIDRWDADELDRAFRATRDDFERGGAASSRSRSWTRCCDARSRSRPGAGCRCRSMRASATAIWTFGWSIPWACVRSSRTPRSAARRSSCSTAIRT